MSVLQLLYTNTWLLITFNLRSSGFPKSSEKDTRKKKNQCILFRVLKYRRVFQFHYGILQNANWLNKNFLKNPPNPILYVFDVRKIEYLDVELKVWFFRYIFGFEQPQPLSFSPVKVNKIPTILIFFYIY